ncbi:hypothetical protein RS030_6890 [Cryptosporidium xiaoi]|uniref:CBS domain-containing protein n=1 Tax=Cryptosporidium xiaoi TaxID=659607 RepID=A0AAV9XUJ2_9CRYT
MNLEYKSENYEKDFLREKKEYLENITSFFSGLNLNEKDDDKLSEEKISQLTFLAREEIRRFLISRCIYEIVPESSKIMAVSSNIPLVIAVCFLLEDKKKSMIVYDEMEDKLIGTFTCNDVLLIFYVIHQLVSLEGRVFGDSDNDNNQGKINRGNNKKDHETRFYEDISTENLELPFSSLEEISNCTLRSWMTEVLNIRNYDKNLRLNVNDTLYDGINAFLKLDDSKKVLNLGRKEFQWKELGCWILQDQETDVEYENYNSSVSDGAEKYREDIRENSYQQTDESLSEGYYDGTNIYLEGRNDKNIENSQVNDNKNNVDIIGDNKLIFGNTEALTKIVHINRNMHEGENDVVINEKHRKVEGKESKEKREKITPINKVGDDKGMYSRTENMGRRIQFGDIEANKDKNDKVTEKSGVYPICYFSPLSVLVSLVQDLQICFGNLEKNIARRINNEKKKYEENTEKEIGESEDSSSYISNSDCSDDFNKIKDDSCNIELEESIIGSFFHKKILGQLNFIPKKNKKCLKSSSSLSSALELFLIEGQTHIPIVSDEDEEYTGRVLTIDKCCTYFARCITGQVKVRMEDSLEQVFPAVESKLQFAEAGSLPNRISDKHTNKAMEIQQMLNLNPNCSKGCYEDNRKYMEGVNLGKECDQEEMDFSPSVNKGNMSSSLVDMCLSGAITHILLSEEQCLVLVDKITSKVTAIFTALDICRFILSG